VETTSRMVMNGMPMQMPGQRQVAAPYPPERGMP
jgi:hypothetical protein